MAINGDITPEKIISKVSHELIVFADSLKPSKAYITEGTKTIQKVFERVQKELKKEEFSVDRILVGESVGKSTSVLYPDFDGVVFLNNKLPPFDDTLDAFKALLESEATSFGISPDSITKRGNAVTVEFDNGTELDLLPAANFAQNPEDQYKKVLEHIQPCKENSWRFSSSLADIQIKFLTDLPGLINQLIRLVKYWYKSLTLDVKVYGGSYLMEILSVTVYHEYENQKLPKSLLLLLKATFEKIAKIDTQKIAFLRENKQWKLLSEVEIREHRDYFSTFILEWNTFIIDPSNPFNDLFVNLTPQTVEQLKQCAGKMLERIQGLESNESNEFKTIFPTKDVTIDIQKIFEPFSLSLTSLCSKKVGIPTEGVVHYYYQSYRSTTDFKIVGNTENFKRNENAKKLSKAMSTSLVTLVRNKARRSDDGKKYAFSKFGLADVAKKEEIKKVVKLYLQENFGEVIRDSDSNSAHTNCDVTLYIPYVTVTKDTETTWAVRISLKW